MLKTPNLRYSRKQRQKWVLGDELRFTKCLADRDVLDIGDFSKFLVGTVASPCMNSDSQETEPSYDKTSVFRDFTLLQFNPQSKLSRTLLISYVTMRLMLG